VKHDRVNTFLEIGIWLLFFALLVPAGLVGFAIGRSTAHAQATVGMRATADGSVSQGKPWSLPNSDLSDTRATTAARISATNVSKLGVAWTMPLTGSSIYGTFAANPVSDDNGVVYLQDLASNVFAVDVTTGHVLWRHAYDSQDIGPNAVTVADGKIYGATAKFAFALDAKTGKELWRNTKLVPATIVSASTA
jgi:outer membrane protein assembly factor BamB